MNIIIICIIIQSGCVHTLYHLLIEYYIEALAISVQDFHLLFFLSHHSGILLNHWPAIIMFSS